MAYQEEQSKKENLIFYGLPEKTDDTRDMCERDVRSLLTDKMGLDHAEDDNVISIERVHRLGRRRQQQDQPRPVVVKFSRYKHRQVVWNNRSKLKDTNYRVAEHFSDSVRERRRILIPRMEEERDRGNTAYLSFDKLLVDDRVFEVDRETKEIVELKQHKFCSGSNSTQEIGGSIERSPSSVSSEHLTVAVWNVNKLKRHERNNDFLDFCETFDILGLLETWAVSKSIQHIA